MDDLTRKSDYKKSANEFWRWKDAGDNLYISAIILEQHYQDAMGEVKKATLPLAGQILSQIIYLKAESLELYLKALFIKQGNLATKNGELTKSLDSHNLSRLCELTNTPFNNHQKVLLNKLTDAISHWGRYPVPKEWTKWRPTIKEIVGIQPIYTWLDRDDEVLENLLLKIKSLL